MKTKSLGALLKILISLLLLSALTVSTLLGTTRAEYFKTLSQKLDFVSAPDVPYKYYLYDGADTNATAYSGATGSYENFGNFSQQIIVGKKDSVSNPTAYTGKSVIYQVQIPVTEEGYYNLGFTVRFADGGEFTVKEELCVGCEVLNSSDGFTFGSNTRLDMPSRYAQGKNNATQSHLYADSKYQWKTLAPARQETVDLAFKVETEDVTKGYVLWMWDFSGLVGQKTYTVDFTNVSVKKTMELDGTSAGKQNGEPYFLFPQTSFINNQISPATEGKNKYSGGRGTYLTQADANGMCAQIEPLEGSGNLVGIHIPLKNIKADTTYKVYFDFSVAKQGTGTFSSNTATAAADANYYSSYDANFFKSSSVAAGSNDRTLHFQSYLFSGKSTAKTIAEHSGTNGRAQITLNNVGYTGRELTRYDEIIMNSTTTLNTSTVTNINSTFVTQDATGTNASLSQHERSRNWFNALRHTENNGQNAIHWLTFTNTTFSFNISKTNNIDLNDLYWVWAIDAFAATAWYRIKIDNVRIEEVVQYGSIFQSTDQDRSGIKIGGDVVDTTNSGTLRLTSNKENAEDADLVFAQFRYTSGTGQNFQARGFSGELYMTAGNTYGTVYDASWIDPAPGNGSGANDYKISLDGYTVCDGGIDRYVWSADGGVTWHDMTYDNPRDATSSQLNETQIAVDQTTLWVHCYKAHLDGQNGLDHIYNNIEGKINWNFVDFDDSDSSNSNFNEWNLTADLSEYKHKGNLDIIFAAVPATNTNLRCEILRIINYNPVKNFRTYTEHFVSDIEVETKGNKLNAHFDADPKGETNGTTKKESKIPFTKMYGVQCDEGDIATAGGYARCTTNYYGGYDIADTRTLFSDFPIKKTLSLLGWAIVEGSVQKYVWTVDGGKTWNDCGGTTKDLSVDIVQRANWYDGSSSSMTSKKGDFKATANQITVNLSGHIGKVVDVIVAAKPNGSDVYVPIGRIDNVAVYGDASTDDPNDRGTFYTICEAVDIDDKGIIRLKNGADGKALNRRYDWNLALLEQSYIIFEPWNVDLYQTRKFNAEANPISNGGKVEIYGGVVCPGGVKRYKYTLDGGTTWTTISKTGANVAEEDELLTRARRSDVSFKTSDGVKGDYGYVYTKNGRDPLTFNIPEFSNEELNSDNVKDLLVVAESTKDKLYPVAHVTLNIKPYGLTSVDENGKLKEITFGSYPQSEVTDGTLKATLDSKVGTLLTNENSQAWTSYGYYKDGSNTENYMWYIDVEEGGEKYRGVYFTAYRPWESAASSSADSSRQDDNGYSTNTVYWFKYEPISWRILSEDTANKKAFIICDMIIDSQAYQDEYSQVGVNWYNTSAGVPEGTYANNYEYSTIRKWLSDTFYETAFNELQKEMILTTTVDNSSTSAKSSTKNSWACNNTQDKVFLLSLQDVTNTAYGFNSSEATKDTTRQRIATAYAKAQGPWADSSSFCDWWLRTPTGDENLNGASSRYVTNSGVAPNGTAHYAPLNCYGVVPVMWISLDSVIACEKCVDWNNDHKCNVCGKITPHVIENGSCTLCGIALNGKKVTFGSYPQTEVTNSTLKNTLTASAGTLPTSSNSQKWTSYGYYRSGNVSNFMWYIDIEEGDDIYRGVYFTSYRPYDTTGTDSNQEKNGYKKSTVHWFKYEPISWTVLKEDTANKKALVLCDMILDSREYYINTSNRTINEKTVMPNNYEHSTIRSWLNDNFYNTAFSTLQKQMIETTMVDNSVESTNLGTNTSYYHCQNTQDKIFLLSYAEAANTSYFESAAARQKQVTAYANAQGVYKNGNGYGRWWLRSPDSIYTNYAREVLDGGTFRNSTYNNNIINTSLGVAPAMWINLN